MKRPTPVHPGRRPILRLPAVAAAFGASLLLPGLAAARSPQHPSATHPATNETPPLVNTYWRLIRLGTASAMVAESAREAHLVLRPPARADQRPANASDGTRADPPPPGGLAAAGQRQAGGSTGCNRFSASYEQHADRLFFGRSVATRMACMPELMRQEAAMLDALARTARFQFDGDRLLLLDSRRTPLALFEPRYLT